MTHTPGVRRSEGWKTRLKEKMNQRIVVKWMKSPLQTDTIREWSALHTLDMETT